jgi:hypothetical protein
MGKIKNWLAGRERPVSSGTDPEGPVGNYDPIYPHLTPEKLEELRKMTQRPRRRRRRS